MRRRWIVLICCLMAVVGLGLAAGALGTRTSDNFSLPGTGSQRAQDLLVDHFPSATKASSPVVFAAREGRVDSRRQPGGGGRGAEGAAAADDVADVSDPFTPATVSRDGRIAYATVTLDGEPQDLTHAAADDIVAATDAARSQLTVAVGGIVGQQAEAQVEDPSEAIGLAIAVIVLLVTFGSFVSMGLPLLTGLIGLGAGLSLVTVLGHFITVPTIGPTLGTMIGLGVGIDYALFLITRHRQNLAAGMTVAESIPRTVATSATPWCSPAARWCRAVLARADRHPDRVVARVLGGDRRGDRGARRDRPAPVPDGPGRHEDQRAADPRAAPPRPARAESRGRARVGPVGACGRRPSVARPDRSGWRSSSRS